jgi:hypothetical protein
MSGIAQLRLAWREMPFNPEKHEDAVSHTVGPVLEARVSGGPWEVVPSVIVKLDGTEEEFENTHQLGTHYELPPWQMELQKGFRGAKN